MNHPQSPIVSEDAKVLVRYEKRTFLFGLIKWRKEIKCDTVGFDIHIDEINIENPHINRLEKIYLNGKCVFEK